MDQSTSQNNGQSEPIDLAQKLADAQKQAEAEKTAGTAQVNQGAEDELVKLRAELESITELAKRTMADFQNYKRRQDEERRVIITMANVDLMRSMLPVVDNLERTFKHIPDSAKTDQSKEWLQGLEISAKQLSKVLTDSGLTPINALNQPFNPDLHEGLAQGPGPADTVIEELEKGYMLGDRVIRHAKVKVGNGSEK